MDDVLGTMTYRPTCTALDAASTCEILHLSAPRAREPAAGMRLWLRDRSPREASLCLVRRADDRSRDVRHARGREPEEDVSTLGERSGVARPSPIVTAIRCRLSRRGTTTQHGENHACAMSPLSSAERIRH